VYENVITCGIYIYEQKQHLLLSSSYNAAVVSPEVATQRLQISILSEREISLKE